MIILCTISDMSSSMTKPMFFIASLQLCICMLSYASLAFAFTARSSHTNQNALTVHINHRLQPSLPHLIRLIRIKTNSAQSNDQHPGTVTSCASDSLSIQTTTVANTTFRIPTDAHLKTISTHQVHHPLVSKQTFCVSKNLCSHCHPQSFGFHPTAGSKLSSGLFRLSCPLLVQAIDDWEATGGVREMSDWLRQNDTQTDGPSSEYELNWKQKAYWEANDMQRRIREDLIGNEGNELLAQKLGEYNAKKFMESGIAGIPPEQTFDVKCIHAHVADHLCRVSSTSTSEQSPLDTVLNGEGNIIGQRALRLLYEKGVRILGNEECWQQCSGSEGWRYVARKNRSGLKNTRMRRKELKDASELDKPDQV